MPPLLNVFTIGVFDLTNSGKELLSIWVITVEVYRPSIRPSVHPSAQSFDCEFEVREPLVDIHQSGYFMRSSKCTNVIVFINTLLKYYLDDNNLIDFWLHLQWGKCSQKWDIILESMWPINVGIYNNYNLHHSPYEFKNNPHYKAENL